MLLSYPLHPPKAPAQMRTAHFPALRTNALFVHGVKDGFGSIEEMATADWDRILRTNLYGPFLLSKAALPLMRSQGGGHIINVVSTAAKRAWANASAYHASKWGLLGFSHALHVEARIAQLDLNSGKLVWSKEIFNIFEMDPEEFGAAGLDSAITGKCRCKRLRMHAKSPWRNATRARLPKYFLRANEMKRKRTS